MGEGGDSWIELDARCWIVLDRLDKYLFKRFKRFNEFKNPKHQTPNDKQ